MLVGNYAVTKERGHRNIVMKLMNYMDLNIGELDCDCVMLWVSDGTDVWRPLAVWLRESGGSH